MCGSIGGTVATGVAAAAAPPGFRVPDPTGERLDLAVEGQGVGVARASSTRARNGPRASATWAAGSVGDGVGIVR